MDLRAIFIACISSTGLASIIVALLNRHWAKKDNKDEKQDAIVEGLKVLTVDRVRYLGKCYMAAQKIELEDKENLESMYQAYKSLGGNGHLETIMEEVRRLPVVNKS